MKESLPSRYSFCVFALVGVLAASASGAELPITNRIPEADEIGYRPADGATVPLNPPSLTWLHEKAAHTYNVQWSRRADFSSAVTVTNLPFNVYTHSSPLNVGEYFWRYRFVMKDGRASAWSVTRGFVVPEGATEFPMPTRDEQRARVPAAHPRLFLRPEDLPRLRELAAGPEAKAFAALRAQADKFIAAGPTPEPEHPGSARDKNNKELIKYWWPNRTQTEQACREAEAIAFVYLITRESKYAAAARQWILHLAAWDPDGPTNFQLNCEAGKPMLYRLPRAYDWAWDALTEADREVVQRAMLRRATDVWNSGEVGRGVGHLNRPYSSHGNRTWHKLAECAIAFLGEIPEAETWLDYAVNKFYAAYPVWSDDDGGWHEGVSYWGGYMNKVVTWLHVAKVALDIDGFRKPFFAQVGDYPLYVAPPGSPNMGFGDLSFRPPPASWGGFIGYFLRAGEPVVGQASSLSEGSGLAASSVNRSATSADRMSEPSHGQDARATNAGYWRWWTEQWNMSGEGGVLGFLYNASLPPLPPARPPTDLPVSKVFRGIGVASLHVTLTNSADDVHLLFKSSPFGSRSHGHNPQNSFQLNAHGEALLTTCVYRDLHGSAFHTRWAWSTRAHNAVLVNGGGQIPHSAASTGRIADFQFTPEWDYVEGDAVPAYGGKLDRARRQIAFVKPDLIVIGDDLAAPQPATFQFLLHALSPFTVDEAKGRLTVQRPKAGLTAQYLSPVPLQFRQWDGYDPKPDRDFPNQWHVEAGTREKRGELQMLTVLVPERAGASPANWSAERLDGPNAYGVRVRRGSEVTLVAFRKSGPGEAELAGVKFEGNVLVRVGRGVE